MKFVRIFDSDYLFAVHYNGDTENIYDVVIEQWNDPLFVNDFLKSNKKDIPSGETIESLRKRIENDADTIDDKLKELSIQEIPNFEDFFKPLNNNEYYEVNLQPQKGRKEYLRIYALKIASDLFLVTGGAIKLTSLMQDAEHTKKELSRLYQIRDYLKENSVDDQETFYSLLLENEDDE